MDGNRFDGLTRSLARSASRRQLIRGAMAAVGAAVGMRSLDAGAARRGYSGPQSNSNNGTPAYSVQPSWSSGGRCQLEGFLTGAPAGMTVYLSVVAYRTTGTLVNESFRVTTDAQGRASARSVGTFDGVATCLGNATVGWDTVPAPPANRRCD